MNDWPVIAGDVLLLPVIVLAAYLGAVAGTRKGYRS